jgi:hypothetical protein
VRLCFQAVLDGAGDLSPGATVQLLGELQLWRGQPILKVHILRRLPGLDCAAHYRAICRLQSHLPCNVRRH